MLPLLACTAPTDSAAEDDCAPEIRSIYYRDADGDGAGDKLDAVAECGAPEGYVASFLDCDDADPAIGPHATDDTCDGIDQDCDAIPDDGAPTFGYWLADADGDGWGAGDLVGQCDPGAGWTQADGDCDDTRTDMHPDAAEVCDDEDMDENCDGAAEGDDAEGMTTWYEDSDGNGFGTSSATVIACDAPEGYTAALATASDTVCSSAVWNDETDVATAPGDDFAFAAVDAFTVRFRADLDGTGGWVLAKGDEWGIGADPIEENGDLWICLHPIVGDPYGCMQRTPGSPADYVVTYDAGEVSWYVDGVSQGEPGYGTTHETGAADLIVGDATDAATGTYDDIAIWSAALSAEEVAALHAGAMVASGLVGWWRFDEGSGTNAADLSGRGTYLTFAGPEWAAECL